MLNFKSLFLFTAFLFFHSSIFAFDLDKKNLKKISDEIWDDLKGLLQQTKLYPPVEGYNGYNAQFGTSVAIDGNRALLGSNHKGIVLVYEYELGEWIEKAQLIPADSSSNSRFGTSVSLLGNRALVGAYNRTGNNSSFSGSAYIFDFNGTEWLQTAKIYADDETRNDYFGSSVSLSNNRALIGAYGNDDQGSKSGSAYIFDYDGVSWTQTSKLIPDDGEAYDYFGRAVSLIENRAIIGSPGDDTSDIDTGSVYIFEFDNTNWSQTSKITAVDRGPYNNFGTSVSLSDDKVLIGATGNQINNIKSGAAYIYEFNGSNWNFVTKLFSNNLSYNGEFGSSVSYSNGRAIVGAKGFNTNTNTYNQGAVFLFEFNGTHWYQKQMLIANDMGSYDQFGAAVDISGDRIFIGAPRKDDIAYNSGVGYMFEYDGNQWIQSQQLSPDADPSGNNFGYSVSVYGTRLLVGMPRDSDNGNESGSAYIYELVDNNWSLMGKILPQDGTNGDLFGSSVSLQSDRAIIGAYGNMGSAYIFDLNAGEWIQSAKLQANDAAIDDFFGYSVSLSGQRALIGAYGDDDSGLNSGSVYVFDFNGTNWSQSEKLIANDNETDDKFGFSVSLNNNRALIGAIGDDDVANASGAAYLYDFDGLSWSQTDKFTSSNSYQYHSFGYSVSLDGNRALIGTNDVYPYNHSAYVFDFDGSNWEQTSELAISADFFYPYASGTSVSLYGDRAMIGTSEFDDNFSHTAYIFDFDGVNWNKSSTFSDDYWSWYESCFGSTVSLYENTALAGAFCENDSGFDDAGSVYIYNLNDAYNISVNVSNLDLGESITVDYNSIETQITENGMYSIVSTYDSSFFEIRITDQSINSNKFCLFTEYNDTSVYGRVNHSDVVLEIDCVPTYSVGGTVSGLFSEHELEVYFSSDHSGDIKIISQNGSYTFDVLVPDGNNYYTFIDSQPYGPPNQTCTIENDYGVVDGANITNVNIICGMGTDLIYRHGFEDEPPNQ